ncbi:MAG: hypothetical protein ACXAAI_02380 [Promethearchaeota archaeon]|jgi:MFS superfamily sulfate permease-like transporter
MPKKYIVFLKTIGRSWFLILVIVIVIIAFFNLLTAIWMAIITLILFLLSYVPKFMLRNKLFKFMKGYYKIEDELIAKKFKKPISKIREKMFELSQSQEKRKWLIVFLNKQYICYHEETIQAFKDVYNKGYSEKEILDALNDYKVTTRAEIKLIKDTLVKLNRLSDRDISVKEHKEKQRFA